MIYVVNISATTYDEVYYYDGVSAEDAVSRFIDDMQDKYSHPDADILVEIDESREGEDGWCTFVSGTVNLSASIDVSAYTESDAEDEAEEIAKKQFPLFEDFTATVW